MSPNIMSLELIKVFFYYFLNYLFSYNRDENVHRFAARGELFEVERKKEIERKKEREREKEREKERERERKRERERERERER